MESTHIEVLFVSFASMSYNPDTSIKVGLSPSKNLFLFASMKAPLNCFLFHLKSSFRSQDI